MGWTRELLPEWASPAGVSRASRPGNTVGTLWADKVLPADSIRQRQETTGQRRRRRRRKRRRKRSTTRSTHTHTHTHAHIHTHTHVAEKG